MIDRLGHVGLHVHDLDRSTEFFRDVVGLTVTDSDPGIGLVFLSSQPDTEHHQLVLAAGRTAPADTALIQQVSFRATSLDDVKRVHRSLRDSGGRIQYVVTHGNAIGVYFFDPDGNRCEVYWPTGVPAKQPFRHEIGLDQPNDAIIARNHELVGEFGADGAMQSSLETDRQGTGVAR
jgi:catechol 2,3-dioxygenase-like lactoylglutathione lyase family enzyme